MGTTTISPRRVPASRLPKALLRLRADDELVGRARGGDEAAFELLYERHVAGILSFCRHMLREPAEAEDAVQHVFAAAHTEIADHDRPLRLKAWLYTVARNRCLSVLRDRHEHPAEIVEPSTEGLHEEVQRRADLREMLTDLHDLPDDQRAALVLSELEDLSHDEIATVLGCRVESVKGLVFRARGGLMERHEAREAPCTEIRAELAAARRGGLRRGRLKHHLKACPGCSAYLANLRRQRRMLAVVLPVAPTAGLKPGLLASLGLGGGAAAGGMAAAGAAGTAATIAVAAVVGGAGLVGQGPLASDPPGDRGETTRRGPEDRPPASAPGPPEVVGASGVAAGARRATGTPRRAGESRAGGAASKGLKRSRRGAMRIAAGKFKPAKNNAKERSSRRKAARPGAGNRAPRPSPGFRQEAPAQPRLAPPARIESPTAVKPPAPKAKVKSVPPVVKGGAGKE